MCGVSFYFSKTYSYENELQISLDLIKHRGPDATDAVFRKTSLGYAGIGHNRLSVIDLTSQANQPMAESEVWLSYNGEIYNFRPLRAELELLGHRFETSSDTEVILRLYLEFGVDAFDKLRGMFAFVIYDERTDEFFLVRDAVGVKPLYFYAGKQELYACSEIRGLRCYGDVDFSVSNDDIFEFFNTGFLYEPSTGFSDIKKVRPGHALRYDMATGTYHEYCYSTALQTPKNNSLGDSLKAAVRDQQVADVPLGVFFSGGIDSSILACLSKDADLLFAQYESDVVSDLDLKYSSLVAEQLGKDLTVVNMQGASEIPSEILKSIHFVADNSEELLADYTFWATYLLSLASREKGFKVMLSGMGGDEGFAGYPRYLVVKYYELIKFFSPGLRLLNWLNMVPSSLNKKFARLLSYVSEKNWTLGYSRLLGYFSREELSELFIEFEDLNRNYESKLDLITAGCPNHSDNVKLAQYLDSKGCLSHNLMVADKASMLASIELRVPLLDEQVYGLGLAGNTSSLIGMRVLKKPLHKFLAAILPKQLVEREKAGFNPPLDGMINRLGEPLILNELRGLAPILGMSAIERIVDEHFSGDKNNTFKIWQLLYFSRWISKSTG